MDLIDQANVKGSLLPWSLLYAGDYNGDGLSELFLFTHSGDTLWLNVLDPFAGSDQLIARKIIPGCRLFNGEAGYKITTGHLGDANGDGSLDFYFSIIAGFTLSPRRVYCYDIANDSLYDSPLAGAGPRSSFQCGDLDDDGTNEYWGKVNAFGNFGDSLVPWSDMSSWLMVFSHDLQFEFEPLEFPAFRSAVDARVLTKEDGTKELVVLRTYDGDIDSIHNEILLVSPQGKIRKREKLPFPIRPGTPVFYIRDQQIAIYDRQGKQYVYDGDLEPVDMLERDWFQKGFTGMIEFPEGKKSLYYITSGGWFYLTDLDHRILARLDLDISTTFVVKLSRVSTDDMQSGFHLKSTGFEQTLALEPNPGRYLVYLYWFAIFLFFLSFIYLVQIFQIRQERKRYEHEKQLRTLQLQSLKSQMNPHFIFNALNSISAMYMQGNSKKADRFLTSFSRMIREVVDSSDRVIVTLREEMDFVENYLELEKIRYGENFRFSFDIPEDCQDVELPSMCIHTFVENSVKHAFPDKLQTMQVEVIARKMDNMVKVQIRDNGIGFGNAGNPSGRTGRGMKIVSEIIRNYARASGRKIHYTYQNVGSGDQLVEGSLVELFME